MNEEQMWRVGQYKDREIIMGIYCIRCGATGRSYVGGAVDVLRRVAQHLYSMKTWPNENEFYQDANRFGIDTLEITLLERVGSRAELCNAEKRWIKQLNAYTEGYNKMTGGRHHLWSDANG